jgi:hypothetical protein
VIVDKLHAHFRAEAAKRRQTGNPTGSHLGACTAQLQQFLFPALTKPEPWQPRGAAVTEQGRWLEQWLADKIHGAFPGQWGLRQQAFYCPVPITADVLGAIGVAEGVGQVVDKIASRLRPDRYTRGGLFWGWEIPGFEHQRPKLTYDATRNRWRVRAIDPGAEFQPGVVLDRKQDPPHVYLAVHIDGMIYHPEFGQILVEQKEMSNYAFRRAVLGELEYRYRCQLLAAVKATGVQHALWVFERKETCHQAEMLFLASGARTRVVLTQPNGTHEVFFVTDPKRGRVVAEKDGAGEQDLPAPGLWDVAEVWTPYSEADLRSVHERALRVLLAEPRQWWREYGPDFRCRRCAGRGERECGNCHGTGLQPKTKGPKPCTRCARAPKDGKPDLRTAMPGRQRCAECVGGLLDEVELGFPCTYAVHEDTPILMADYSWKPARKIGAGEAVVGFTEDVPAGRRGRKIVPTTIEAVARRAAQPVTIWTEYGSLVCSPEHPWLVMLSPPGQDQRRRQGIGWRDAAHWRRADRIAAGMRLFFFADPLAASEEDQAYMGGYIRGLVEGDGTVQWSRADHRGVPRVRVALTDPEPLDRLERYLAALGVPYQRLPFAMSSGERSFAGRKSLEQIRFGGRAGHPHVLRLLHWRLEGRGAAGYLGGLYDAEGSLDTWSLRIHQKLGPVLRRALAAAHRLGIDLRLEPWERVGGRALRLYSPKLTAAMTQFFTLCRPAISRKRNLVGKPIITSWVPVLAVERVDTNVPMIDLQTSSKTFVAGGFASHNCPVAVTSCWTGANVVRTIDTRPHLRIRRADYERSGLTFVPPEPTAVALLPEETEEEAAVEEAE